MLDRFKDQARKAVTKKQRELDNLFNEKQDFETRLMRLKERIKERKIRNFWSDESEESEEEPAVDFFTREVDMEEYVYVKAQRKRAKLEITKWVKKFRDENDGNNPTDLSTQEIALELADFNHVNMQYLEVKMAMIKQDKMPFQPEDFFNAQKQQQLMRGTTKSKKSNFKAAQDQFLNTLSQGFGAAAGKNDESRNDPNRSLVENSMIGTPGGGGAVNYYEIRCKELQEEIDELHRLINEGHGHDSIVASYIDQVKRKDRLLMERDGALDELQTRNSLGEKEREVL